MSSHPQVFLVLAVAVHVVAHQLLRYMAQPLLGPNGELLEAGMEINTSFISEYACVATLSCVCP